MPTTPQLAATHVEVHRSGSHRVVVVDRDLTAEGLAGWWNGLPQARRTVMLRWEYLSTWWRAFAPRGSRLQVHVVLDGGQPVAALPLYKRHGTLWSLAGSAHSEVFDAAYDVRHADAIAPLLQVLLRRRTHLERLDGASPLLAGLRAARPPMIVDVEHSPYLDLPATADELLRARSSKFRAGIRRAVRALESLGEVTFREYREGDDGMAEAFATLLRIEASGWKGRDGTAIVSRPDTLRFHRELVEGPVRRWVRIGVLRVADRPVAAQLDLEYRRRRYGLKTGCVDDLGPNQSPGTVVLWRTLAAAIDRGVRSMEFGGDADAWKRHWTHTAAERVVLRTWPHTATGHLTYGAREQAKHALRPLRGGRPCPR